MAGLLTSNTMTLRMRSAAAALLCALVLACAPAWPPVRYSPDLHFETVPLHIVTARDSVTITAELAVTQRQMEQGLMEREHLPEDRGMLFVFDEPQDADFTFYMYRTRIPLDVAFIDDDGTILRIMTMDPCPEPSPARCPRYEAGVGFSMALEVNRGFFAGRGIGPGARVIVDLPAHPSAPAPGACTSARMRRRRRARARSERPSAASAARRDAVRRGRVGRARSAHPRHRHGRCPAGDRVL